MGLWPRGLSWVLVVWIQAKRLYEAGLLGEEGGPGKRHSSGQWTPVGSLCGLVPCPGLGDS